MIIDDETGLPELPEGYFWRIAKWNPAITERVSIAIMEIGTKRHWFKTVPWNWEFYSISCYAVELEQSEDPESFVREIAADVYRVASKKWLGQKQRDRIERIYGDYPPKKLETK